ncbi:hypothetical protein Pmani_021856 [Petrolisthes manimaculis]|uniref:Uncharacterized protein n=1 Tax=Petrolisthes manimaculis TaxID=1843537 RepID=A0AAE1U4V9_9EUCA|nr:hypothetical protein Pmani_021856 [Petrolisthes manimaculis]
MGPTFSNDTLHGLPDLDDSLGLLQLDQSLKNSLKILYEQVKQRQEKVNKLREREKKQHLKTFRWLKKTLEQMMEDLQQPNKSRFKDNILSQMEELFTLSQANLQQLNRLVDGYEQKVIENK